MNLSRSIQFLLDHGGDVLRYRLHKEILKDLTPAEEEAMLERVLQAPHYQLLLRYVKPNGYIGLGMHSWDKFKETLLEDGEAAARLLAYYAIPKDWPIVKNMITALRDEQVLEEEFSYYKPEMDRFRNRFLGLKNGGGLMGLVYTCQALLGYGDEKEVQPFVNLSYEAFESLLQIQSLADITTYKPQSKKKYNYPYLEENVPFPCQYHLETLAYTRSWRSEEAVDTIVRAINHHDRIMKEENNVHVKIGSQYYVPLWAYVRPFRAFDPQHVIRGEQMEVAQRKTLTHLAMVGGKEIEVVQKTVEAVKAALAEDGVLRVKFESPYRKRYFKENMKYPGPYSEIALEPNHRTDTAIWCELTFWAVQLLHLLGEDLE